MRFPLHDVQQVLPSGKRLPPGKICHNATLLDGEMVVDEDMESGIMTRRFLAYDLIILNGESVAQCPFKVNAKNLHIWHLATNVFRQLMSLSLQVGPGMLVTCIASPGYQHMSLRAWPHAPTCGLCLSRGHALIFVCVRANELGGMTGGLKT